MFHVVTDTHGLIWYLADDPSLSTSASEEFDYALQNNMAVGVSVITIVEIIYLIEKGRIHSDTLIRLENELSKNRPLLQIIPLTYGISKTLQRIPRSQVPDMPDRIIAATALYHKVPLISRDREITLSDIETIW